jgi:hypothetical protein
MTASAKEDDHGHKSPVPVPMRLTFTRKSAECRPWKSGSKLCVVVEVDRT